MKTTVTALCVQYSYSVTEDGDTKKCHEMDNGRTSLL